jgi:23S rRNA (cytidine2498-2'-O)-methyltransferase
VADFAFATCTPGFERELKLDVATRRPQWRLAFGRPGLVTFKVDGAGDLAAMPAPSPFARVWGLSLGKIDRDDELDARIGAVDRVHVIARDGSSATGEPAEIGHVVADVIVAPDEPRWIGRHVHAAWRSPHPGGAIPVAVPSDAPSRAYAKIEEAIAWAGLDVAAGQVAVEIGAAPGGAALALARRGVHVAGVDAAAIDPAVLATGFVEHLPVTVGALRWEQLPPRVDWLLVDMNVAPQIAVHEVARLMPRLLPTLRGAVFTLKLNQIDFVAELPRLEARIAELTGFDVHVTHLPSNRREVCAVAIPSSPC